MSLAQEAVIFVAASIACVLGLCAVPADAHSPKTKLHAPYPDSTQGLKQELKDMREVARKGRSDQLQAMVADLEIPDARGWYLTNLGTSGPELADAYEKNLTRSERDLADQMIGFAREDGYFSVKKQDAKKVFPSVTTVPEVFLASWESTSLDGEDHSDKPFGYFWFIDGKFRWDSTTVWVTLD